MLEPLRRGLARPMAVVAVALAAHGCASSGDAYTTTTANGAAAERAAEVALAQRGAPYRYGGEQPSGFDCSGLVHYAYARAGVDVPRTSERQAAAVRPLDLDRLMPGDLIFFRTEKKKRSVSHVGIYVGDGHFVHALNRERPVMVSTLESRYWRRRVVRAGAIAR